MISAPNRLVLLAFLLVVILAGSNVVAVRFTVAELPPFWGAVLRFSAAALIFWTFVPFQRRPIPRGRALIGIGLYGFLAFGAGYAFLYWGIQEIPAGLVQVVLALVPLFTLFFAFLHGLEQFRVRSLLGALLAAAGIAWTFFDRPSAEIAILPLLAIIAGAACFAESAVLIKLFPRSEPFVTNAIGLSVGALTLLLFSLLAGEPWSLPVRAETWLSLTYLVLVGSVLVFYLFLYILARWTASATSYQFVLMPFVTVVVAARLAGESLDLGLLLGGALVLAGVWIGAFSGKPTREARSMQPATASGIGPGDAK